MKKIQTISNSDQNENANEDIRRPPFRIVPLKVPKGPLSRISTMFAPMFLAMFLTNPPLRNSASPLRKTFAFVVAVQIVYQL